MKSYKLGILLLVSIAVVGFTAAATRSNPGKKESHGGPLVLDGEQWPVAEYDAPESADEEKRKKRRAKSSRYDKEDRVQEPGSVPGYYEMVVINDWETKIPALPARASDSVLIGEVTRAEAFLSNDKTGVYSEFIIQVNEVLKNDSRSQLNIGDSITTERLGGELNSPPIRCFQSELWDKACRVLAAGMCYSPNVLMKRRITIS